MATPSPPPPSWVLTLDPATLPVHLLHADTHLRTRADVVSFLATDPLFSKATSTPHYTLNMPAHRDQVLARLAAFASHGWVDCGELVTNFDKYMTPIRYLSFIDYSLAIKAGVHFTLCGGTIAKLGSEAHREKYLPAINSCATPGCFAMTELGHGSDVMGIETRADLDTRAGNASSSGRVFVLNTPSKAAVKWWIGGAALHAKVSTVFAQLYVDGDWKGPHAFVVRLRDDAGNVMPGIRIRDNGHKMGLNGVDNGEIEFHNVQVPVNDLLDRHARVDPSTGAYSSPHKTLSARFGATMGGLTAGRVLIGVSAIDATKLGLLVAVRYAHNRPQFNQPSLFGFATHRRRLAIGTARVYALELMSQNLLGELKTRSDTDPYIHLLSSAMKAAATWTRLDVLQNCRECCGGQGFLAENQIGPLLNDMNVDVTFEGDNTVLMHTVAKSLVKLAGPAQKTPLIPDDVDLDSPDSLLALLAFREQTLIQMLARSTDPDADLDLATHLGWAFTDRLGLQLLLDAVAAAPAGSPAAAALRDVATLFGLARAEAQLGFYIIAGPLSVEKADGVRAKVNEACARVTGGDAGEGLCKLVEGFGVPEVFVSAPIAGNDWRAVSKL